MSTRAQATQDLYQQLDREAEEAGYHLNPDVEFTLDLVEGLVTNRQRYGYPSCPCRLAHGERAADRDIICPCDYRDPDLDEYGSCFCGLYVSEEIVQGKRKAHSIPERRRSESQVAPHGEELVGQTAGGLPIWRCKVCGYLCARPQPPLKCPVCKADKDRFERFAFGKTG